MTTSQNTHDDAACLRLFAETLERLNDVFSGQMLSILNIATAAADAAKTLEPASTDADAFLEKVKTILDDMKAESAAVGESGSVTHGSGEGKHGTFCVAILQALSSQQRLNVMGASVLAEGAQLVLNAGAK
jgi:hypothetical protein